MSIFEVIGGPITHRYLMGKTKDEIARIHMHWVMRGIGPEDAEAIRAELTRLRDEHAKLLGFVRAVIACRHDDGIDGFDLQDMAETNGILIPETRTEPCSEDCACAEIVEFPLTCYRLAEFVRAP